MPAYRNETENNITPVGGQTVKPGKGTGHLNQYLKNEAGLTLVQHARPGTAGEETTVSSFPSSTINLYMYDNFRITNGTDAVITLTYNGDSSNAEHVLPTQSVAADNADPKNYHSVVIAGSGSGSVYVRGWK